MGREYKWFLPVYLRGQLLQQTNRIGNDCRVQQPGGNIVLQVANNPVSNSNEARSNS